MRYHSTTGLTDDQITELVAGVAQVARRAIVVTVDGRRHLACTARWCSR